MDPRFATNANAAHAAAAAANAADGDETVTRTTTTTETVSTKPGFFGKIARYLKKHPIQTSVGASLGATATGVGVFNYRRYGQVLPPVISANDMRDVAAALTGQFN